MFLGVNGFAANQLSSPQGIARDPSTGTLYVADMQNNRIMSYLPTSSSGTVVAGGNGQENSGTQLNRPFGVYFDSSTNSLIIVNSGANNIVRWVLGTDSWTLVAGSGDGISGSDSNLLNAPKMVTFDIWGNMYVVDTGNHRVQLFAPKQTAGITIAGVSGVPGNSSDLLNEPWGVALDTNWNLYVSDRFNHRIQKFLRY